MDSSPDPLFNAKAAAITPESRAVLATLQPLLQPHVERILRAAYQGAADKVGDGSGRLDRAMQEFLRELRGKRVAH
jgi:hypothetical protein